ncbi:hypothetical protein OHB01_27085 [Microbispora hainanensis]|uniref:hypothetical protein n=1 Tax=Microbispora hainanensis TaxID=568844 RepID=UPI002E2CE1F4|nr:hypothetical protein [Microbispora hainanensis]
MVNATAFAAALAEEIAPEDRGGGWLTRSPAAKGFAMPEHGATYNIARDNARVGVQAGAVQGDVRLGVEPDRPADLVEALAGFGSQLGRAWEDGRLAEDTYIAARAELGAAEEALQTEALQTEALQGKGRLPLALEKLRGLIRGVGERADPPSGGRSGAPMEQPMEQRHAVKRPSATGRSPAHASSLNGLP